MTAFSFKRTYEYLNKDFKKFIIEENKYYAEKRVELIGGEEGRYIAFQLPDNEQDFNNMVEADKLISNLPPNAIKEVDEEESSA